MLGCRQIFLGLKGCCEPQKVEKHCSRVNWRELIEVRQEEHCEEGERKASQKTIILAMGWSIKGVIRHKGVCQGVNDFVTTVLKA